MHPSHAAPSSLDGSLAPGASSLRPRARRLVSTGDDEPALGDASTLSPIPSTHPSRARAPPQRAALSGRDSSSPALADLWGHSWSALQGLASSVLGSDATPHDGHARRRRPRDAAAHHRRTSSSAPPKQWGPPAALPAAAAAAAAAAASSSVGAGSQVERESAVRAMKRKELLVANSHLYTDTAGRFKRRNSDDRTCASAPPSESEDRDALVYVHRVRPQDTLAGITIKYNCHQAVLRKANRMWPNDSVQTRQTVVLPVDACGVKGRPAPDPTADGDLLGDSLLGGGGGGGGDGTWPGPSSGMVRFNAVADHFAAHGDADARWRHDAWVLLPNDTEATEIVRLSRRKLGYFPPSRRRSIVYSDRSPGASLDLPRSTGALSSPPPPPPPPPTARGATAAHHRRRSSTLQGPGGVGTLAGRSLGPAPDRLNTLLAPHLPSVAPPPDEDRFPSWDAPPPEASGRVMRPSPGGTGASTPTGGAALDLERVGGAIEGWMRKVATRASTMLAEPSPAAAAAAGKRAANGDAIELRASSSTSTVDSDAPRGRPAALLVGQARGRGRGRRGEGGTKLD